jgi:hypothetical protein
MQAQAIKRRNEKTSAFTPSCGVRRYDWKEVCHFVNLRRGCQLDNPRQVRMAVNFCVVYQLLG